MSYSTADAIKELAPVLDDAPSGAVSGEWTATTMQAGTSSCSGGYQTAEGEFVKSASREPLKVIQSVIEKLDAAKTIRFNKLVVRWTRSRIPFLKGQVALEAEFDTSIVPRGPDDPIYQEAAAARLNFWQRLGAVADEFAAVRGEANIHNQTKWFGPHRRVVSIRQPDRLILATDGLSTPWAGISEPENGVECEIFMGVDPATMGKQSVEDWAHLLIGIGDRVADGYRIARDVEKHGAVLFCRLTDDYAPMSRLILSRDRRRIEGLPFGTVPLLRATPISEAEIEGQDLSDDWAAIAAGNVLKQRGVAP